MKICKNLLKITLYEYVLKKYGENFQEIGGKFRENFKKLCKSLEKVWEKYEEILTKFRENMRQEQNLQKFEEILDKTKY